MNKFTLLVFLIFSHIYLSFSQEICDNGIDDNNNNLIDLNDPECICQENYFVSNYSFEDTLCCPTDLTQTDCIFGWLQPSEATTDYFHSCGFLENDMIPILSTLNPHGDGFIGFLNGSWFSPSYKEYIASCLNEPLESGVKYKLFFSVGFGSKQIHSVSSDSIFELALYGKGSCSDIIYEGEDCPLNSNVDGWMELGKKTIKGINEWKYDNFEFTPPFDINAIIIGPSCLPASNPSGSYHFLDGVSIFKESQIINLISGLPCLGNAIIGIEEMEGNTYQWYHNGIAILDAVSNLYSVPSGEEFQGNYEVIINAGVDCIQTLPFLFTIDGFPIADLDVDTLYLCQDEPLMLGQNNKGNKFEWTNGSSTQTISVNEEGLYAVTVTNECGEDYDEIQILHSEDRQMCILEIPNVFTPNGDGINDSFSPISDCCFTNYTLQIFSRWGELVFESNDISNKWNGKNNNLVLPLDLYVWVFTYSTDGGIIKKTSGEVTLLR